VETGSDVRPMAKVAFFETESVTTAVAFWVPLAVVSWATSFVIAVLTAPLRFAATLCIRAWRMFSAPPQATGRGDYSDAVARARQAVASSSPELPKATASWLLDPRTTICTANEDGSRDPSVETISVAGLRTEVLVLPAVGAPPGVTPTPAPSARRGRMSVDLSASAAEASGASPGVGKGAVVVVVFPGNPGGSQFYADFLRELSAVSGQTLSIVCVSHAGHTSETATVRTPFTQLGADASAYDTGGDVMTSGWLPGPAGVPEEAPDLAQQSRHKAAFLADLLASDPTLRFILAGHSIGAWMAKDVAASLPAASLLGVVGVYPTMELLGTTRRGRLGFPVFRFLAGPLSRLAGALSLLPSPVIAAVARLVLGSSASPSTLAALPSLVSGPVVRNALTMAYHEMKEVGPMAEESDQLVADLGKRLVLFYGRDDHWNAVGEPEAMRARLPASTVVVDAHDNSHSFVLDTKQCESVAASLWGYLRSVLVLGGVRPRKRADMPAGGPVVNGGSPLKTAAPPSPDRRSARRSASRGPDDAADDTPLRRRTPLADAAPARRRTPVTLRDPERRPRRSSLDGSGSAQTGGRFRAAATRALARSGASPVVPAAAALGFGGAAAAARAAAAFGRRGRRTSPVVPPRAALSPQPRGPVRREASVESTGGDSAMDFGQADAMQREASIESVNGMIDRAGRRV